MTRFAPHFRTLLVCALLLLAVTVHTAEATHFLGGKITWTRDTAFVGAPGQVKIDIKFQATWRWSYPWPAYPPLDSTPGLQYPLTVTTAQNSVQQIMVAQKVLAIAAADDWFLGDYQFSIVLQASQFPVTVMYTNCCRASTLRERNNDTDWILRTVIDITKGSRSPESTLLPRITLTQNVANLFQIPTIAYEGLTNFVTLTQPSFSGLVQARPMGTAACTNSCTQCFASTAGTCADGLQVTNTGLVSWTPQIAGLYAVQFTIVSADGQGNLKNFTPLDFLIDVQPPCNPDTNPNCNTPPTIVQLPSSSFATAGKQFSLDVTAIDQQVQQIVAIASSALPGGATFTPLTSPPSNNMVYRLLWTPTGAQVGDHPVCFQAYDNAGGTSLGQMCTTIHVQPSPPPQLFCNAVPTLQADHNGAIGVALSGATVDPDGTAVSVLLTVGPTTIGTATIPAGTMTLAPFSAVANFPQGTTTVTVTATDAAGASATCDITVNVVRQPQGIAFTGQDPVPFAPNGLVTLNGVASSGLPVSYAVLSGPGQIVGGQLRLNGVGVIEVRASQGGDPDYSPASDVNAFFHVVDVTAPVIAPHAPEFAEATSTAGAQVAYTSPSFNDDVDGAGTASCTPVSGSTFPVGTTNVSCHAQDAAGNGSDSTFAVTVNDTTAPTIDTNPNITTSATTPAGAVVNFAPPAASDIADGAIVAVCNPPSGSTFPLGTTQVTCTATDAHGNHASSSFSVTVTNNAPSVSVPANITAEATSAGGAIVNFVATANDVEDGPLTPVCTPAAGLFGFGTTMVQCTATDVAGAHASASFAVTVHDTTAPVVTYSGNVGTYSIGQTIDITCAAADAVGVVSTTCANISGPAYTFAASNTFSATATDAAGNTGSGSTSFNVVTTLDGLQQLVNSFCNNPGVCQGLNAKLTAAANAPNANARKGQLGAFENQVAAQTGKCMTAQQAAILLQLVRAFFNY